MSQPWTREGSCSSLESQLQFNLTVKGLYKHEFCLPSAYFCSPFLAHTYAHLTVKHLTVKVAVKKACLTVNICQRSDIAVKGYVTEIETPV